MLLKVTSLHWISASENLGRTFEWVWCLYHAKEGFVFNRLILSNASSKCKSFFRNELPKKNPQTIASYILQAYILNQCPNWKSYQDLLKWIWLCSLSISKMLYIVLKVQAIALKLTQVIWGNCFVSVQNKIWNSNWLHLNVLKLQISAHLTSGFTIECFLMKSKLVV